VCDEAVRHEDEVLRRGPLRGVGGEVADEDEDVKGGVEYVPVWPF
jgi:hypothetical protein